MRVFRSILLAMAFVLTAASAWAQTEVAFFLTPKIGAGTPVDSYRPKYITLASGLGSGVLGAGNDITQWQGLDYGLETVFLVAAPLTPTQRTALQAQPDVLVVPSNLASQVSALALSTIQAKLEAVNLPGNWVTSAHTYRDVVRGFRRVITFMQRWRGLTATRLFGGGVTLDTRLNQLPQDVRQNIELVAADLGLATSGVTNTTTLRDALKVVADQLPDLVLQGESL